MGSSLVLAPGYCVCVRECVFVHEPVRVVYVFFFPWRWEQQSDVKESRESSHILSIPLFQSLSRSCYPKHVTVSLLWSSCLMFPLCLQHHTFPSVSLALSLHILWYFSPQSQQNPVGILMLWVLCPVSSASLWMSPHACGRLFFVVHWLLFCHYMLQIGGFVFYDDVCTWDWKVKHCCSLLA